MVKKYESILDALDDHDRVIFCNSIRQVMYVVDYDEYKYNSGMWHNKIELYKEKVKCGFFIVGSWKEWFIDENHQICIIPE